MRLRAILANRSQAQGGELSSKPNTGLGAVGEPTLDLDGHLHDKISDQVDLADRGGRGPILSDGKAPHRLSHSQKFLQCLFNGPTNRVLDERSRKITINRVIGPGTCRFLVALAQLTTKSHLRSVEFPGCHGQTPA